MRQLLEGDLDNIVAKAMCKEPARRYPSVAQFSDDIRRHCDGLPVSARRDTVGYRTGKFVRRNKVAVAAGVLVLLSLFAGLVAPARRERDSARVALRQAERLDDFLQNLLRSADPEAMGKDVKVIQVLDASGKNLDQELADEPEVLTKAHESISLVYGHLGQLEPSEQHMRAALELRRRLHGEDDPGTMRSELWMAGALGNEGKFLEAEPLLRQALAARHRQSPPDAYWTARTADVLGTILGQTGRPVEGEKLLQEALDAMRAARGENSAEAINIVFELGWTRLSAGDLKGAEADLQQAVACYDQYAAHSVGVLQAQRDLALCLVEEQRFPEARRVVERAEADTLQMAGNKGSYYALVRLVRACLDFAEGEYSTVVEEVRVPLASIVAASPNDHVHVIEARGLLGLALARTGRAAEGEAYLRLAYAEAKGMPDATLDLLLGNPATALGECLLTEARYAEAEPLLREGYDHLKARFGTQHPMTIRADGDLRDLYEAWRKPVAASDD